MKILFLTQYYPPETCAAPLRAYHFATNLAKNGHDVTVVTGMPNHPSGVKPPGYRGRVWVRESMDGVRVLRCYLYSTPKKTFLRRMLNQISFAVTGFFGGLAAGRFDILLVTSPPLFLGATGWLLSVLRRTPFVLDVRDLWPRAAVALGQLRAGRALRLAEGLERFLYRRAARIVAVTDGMKRMMIERNVPEHRIDMIMNGADTEKFCPGTAADAANGSCTVLYSGTHGLVHGMDIIIEAAEKLRDETAIRFVLVGDGVAKESLVREAAGRELPNVEFLPAQQPAELVNTIRASDICLATTAAGDFSSGTIVPVKMFDYMACGRAVVAVVGGDAQRVIERSGGGVVVEPGDSESLAATILELSRDRERRDDMGAKGREFVEKKHSRQGLSEALEGLLERIVEAESSLGNGSMSFRTYVGVKYLLDCLGALALLVLSSPLLLCAAVAVRLDSRGRALFTQRRIGIHSHEFVIYKFRTMDRSAPDLATDIMNVHARDYTTRVGRILRKTSLDELPNLWNIFKGDMSLVGPRPALYNQYELIDRRRLSGVDLIRPGLTGWAQINGRDSITSDEKARLDEFYVRNCSIALDLKILLKTVTVMFNGDE